MAKLVVNAYGDNKLVTPVPEIVPLRVVVPEFVNAVKELVPFNMFATEVKVAYVLDAVAVVR